MNPVGEFSWLSSLPFHLFLSSLSLSLVHLFTSGNNTNSPPFAVLSYVDVSVLDTYTHLVLFLFLSLFACHRRQLLLPAERKTHVKLANSTSFSPVYERRTVVFSHQRYACLLWARTQALHTKHSHVHVQSITRCANKNLHFTPSSSSSSSSTCPFPFFSTSASSSPL